MLGFGLAAIFILLVIFFRGGDARGLFDLHALVMVVGGSFVAVAVSVPGQMLARIPQLLLLAAVGNPPDCPTIAAQLVKASDRVRQGGRTAAVGSPRDMDNAFLRSGLQYVADGFDPAEIRNLLEAELHAMRARHRAGISMFENLGGFSPVFGILGTVEAMVAILGSLSSPDKLGPEIALAMVATLYGVAFANLIFIPVANRLKKLSEEELRVCQLVVDVTVAIQEGAKPEFIRERLRAGLPPEIRRTIASKSRSRQRAAQTQAASAAATIPAAPGFGTGELDHGTYGEEEEYYES